MIYSEFAPAKINLFLDVLRKRPDGYHDIGTVFQTINAGDTLRAECDSSGEIRLSYDTPQEYPLASDLVYKTAILLQREFGVRQGVRLHLEKRMPLGAGLGGGSADAAAALRLLNRIWNLGLPNRTLCELGARLGADVPFLVEGGTAMAEGIGDLLTPLAPASLPADYALLVATPLCAVPTAAAYGGITPSGDDRWNKFKAGLVGGKTLPDPASEGFDLFNKFEESVNPKFPPIVELKEKMLALGAKKSLLSGSGASVFGFFPNRELALKAQSALRPQVRWASTTQFFFPNIELLGATAL